MSLEKFKYLDINGTQYRIGRVTPLVGSYILGQLMQANLKRIEAARSWGGERSFQPRDESEQPVAIADPDGVVRATAFGALLGGLDFKSHEFIQLRCMEVCAEMTGRNGGPAVPMPIATADGTLVPQIAEDLPLVLRLEMEVLVFNLSRFFEEGGLNALTKPTTS